MKHGIERRGLAQVRGRFGGVRHESPEIRRKALDLGLPVRKQRGRGDDEAEERRSGLRLAGSVPARGARAVPRLRAQMQEQRDHLQRLAQPHVIREARAESQSGEQGQPLRASHLIGPQGGFQPLHGQVALALRIAQAGEQSPQPVASLHAAPDPQRLRQLHDRAAAVFRAGEEPHALVE
jgi:hypothetical protein